MNELFPDDWETSKLADVTLRIVGGGTPSKSQANYYEGKTPWMTVKDMNKFILDDTVDHISEDAIINSSTNVIPAGIPIIATRMSLGKIVRANFDSAINQDLKAIFLNKFVSNRYFEYWYRNIAPYIVSIGKGTTVKGIRLEQINELNFPLSSTAEQKQIAAKLDELLAQVDTLKTCLDNIPTILKRFRQSVLAAAVSGKLTEEWRGNNKYIVSEFGWDMPAKWTLVTVEDIAEVRGGKRLPKGEVLVSNNTGSPYIRAGQLKNNTVVNDGQLFLEKHVQEKIARYIVNKGDAYITIVGACIGDAGLIPEEYDGANLTENAAKICNFKKPLVGSFLSFWLRSQYLQDIIKLEIKSGAQGKLALKRIKTLPLPYPEKEEQAQIVKQVEKLFTFADKIEQSVKEAQKRVNNLTRSILAKAFRGELTADWREQNPDLISGENSAKALLEKIKAEREALTVAKKKTAKKKRTTQSSSKIKT